jgi:hypothetical protein
MDTNGREEEKRSLIKPRRGDIIVAKGIALGRSLKNAFRAVSAAEGRLRNETTVNPGRHRYVPGHEVLSRLQREDVFFEPIPRARRLALGYKYVTATRLC